MKTSWYKIRAQADSAEISIFGDIGTSWWGESVSLIDFKKDFDAVKDRESIKLMINSPGGDVFDGMGIYNLISGVRQKVTVEVLGMAASIASIIALSGKELVMGEGSYFMIHQPWSFSIGTAESLRKDANLLDKIEDQLVSIYAQNTDMPEAEIVAAMAEETWYTAGEAVDAGYAVGVADYGQMAASYDLSRYKYAHVPSEIPGTETPSDVPKTPREFEARVRDMGYSKREATAIASHGFTHRDDAEPEVEQAESEPEVQTVAVDDGKVIGAWVQGVLRQWVQQVPMQSKTHSGGCLND